MEVPFRLAEASLGGESVFGGGVSLPDVFSIKILTVPLTDLLMNVFDSLSVTHEMLVDVGNFTKVGEEEFFKASGEQPINRLLISWRIELRWSCGDGMIVAVMESKPGDIACEAHIADNKSMVMFGMTGCIPSGDLEGAYRDAFAIL